MTHKYFELTELLKSDTALTKRIDNSPTWEVVQNLDELVTEILDPLREAYGRAIKVSSGYRCKKLNAAVQGAATSVHQKGYAADLQVSGSFNNFRDFVVSWFQKTGRPFDQLLIETNKKTGAKWLHIGIRNNAGEQRRQIKVMEVSK